MLSFGAAVGCLVMGIPPILIGAIAKSTAWNQTSYHPIHAEYLSVHEIPETEVSLVLPHVLQFLTPWWIAVLGTGAVSAAVMSSVDSSFLSAASMLAHNIWKRIFRPRASEREVSVVMRVCVAFVGIIAMFMALLIRPIYGLWYLCADLVYIVLFPQLICEVYLESSNTYGSLAGCIVGLLLRMASGETLLAIPALILYPWYDPVAYVQYFPFRTISMLLSLFTIVGVSLLTKCLFIRGILPRNIDFLRCVVNIPQETGFGKQGEQQMQLLQEWQDKPVKLS